MEEELLHVLEDLRECEFKDFKWYLQQSDIVEGYRPIKVSKLEEAERRDTVNLMVNAFTRPEALKVVKKIFEKICRNDLLQRLSDSRSEPEGQSHFHR